MANPIGVTFMPSQQNQDMGGRQGGLETGGSDLAQAFKVLSLRLPRVLGAGALSPRKLLESPGASAFGGGTNPDAAIFQALIKSMLGGDPSPYSPSPYTPTESPRYNPTAPSNPYAPTTPTYTPSPYAPTPLPRGPEAPYVPSYVPAPNVTYSPDPPRDVYNPPPEPDPAPTQNVYREPPYREPSSGKRYV